MMATLPELLQISRGGGGGKGDVKFKEFPGFLEFQESVETLYLRAISLEKT